MQTTNELFTTSPAGTWPQLPPMRVVRTGFKHGSRRGSLVLQVTSSTLYDVLDEVELPTSVSDADLWDALQALVADFAAEGRRLRVRVVAPATLSPWVNY